MHQYLLHCQGRLNRSNSQRERSFAMCATAIRPAELFTIGGHTTPPTGPTLACDFEDWSFDAFTREQIRGLVRQVFFSSVANPVRQVVFSAAESETDIGSLCRQVGHALSLETHESIAVVSRNAQAL